MAEHILIVEDDVNVAQGLRDILSGCGYRVSAAKNSQEALKTLDREWIHLVLLDVTLGAESGFDLCRRIRGKADVPVLYLTACSSEMELVRGFQTGGDDYVTKPFRVQELIVRIQALLRRSARPGAGPRRSGELTWDRDSRQVKRAGAVLELTATEWRLAWALMERWPQTLSREELLYQVWDKDASFVEANTLNVNISRLREKLGEFEGVPYIETVRGVGYRWAVPVDR